MNTKITIPSRIIKDMAWNMGKGMYWKSVLILLFCNVIAIAPEYIAEALTDNAIILELVSIACRIVEIYLNLGLTAFFLRVFRGEAVNHDCLTEFGSLLPKAIVLEIISGVEIFLKTLLFIVPGIICAIQHSQIFNVLIDHPDYKPYQCIEKSHELMQGNKMAYFRLQLSFLIPLILSSLPEIIYKQSRLQGFSDISLIVKLSTDEFAEMFREFEEKLSLVESEPIYILLTLIPLFVTAYICITKAAFYDIAAGNILLAGEAASDEYDDEYL